MKKRLRLITLCFLLIILSAQNIQANFKIILNFDDNYQGVYENAFPIMQKYDIPGVLYVIVKTIGSEKHLTYEQLLELKKAGWEIGSHTIHHSNLETLTPQGLYQEIALSRLQLQQLGLIDSTYASFCSPMAKWNQEIEKMVAEHYQVARGKKLFIFQDKQGENSSIASITPKVVVKETALSVFQNWITEAIQNNQPLVLVFHEVAEGGNEYSFPPEKFKKVIDLIKDYPVITYQELYQDGLPEL